MTRRRIDVQFAMSLLFVVPLSCTVDGPDDSGTFTGTSPIASSTVGSSADDSSLDDAGDEGDSGSDDGGGSDGGSAADDDAGDGPAGDGGSDDGTTGDVVPYDSGLCGMAPPMGSPNPPGPPSYSGGSCPTFEAGYNTNFQAGGRNREFALILPSDIDETGTYPLLFAWYHISGDAMDFVDTVDGQALADAGRGIIVVPQDSGMFDATWPDTPLDIGQSDVDLDMFDDLYACLSEQFPINTQCVGSVGVSAGGLWTSYLGTKRGQYFASNITISGGHPSEIVGPWWPWVSKRRFATIVMWGGPSDVLGVDFNAASHNLLDDYTGSDHFVLRCEHNNGHGIPPAGDGEPLNMAVDFFRNHPFWLDGDSPLEMGLPAYYPSYCNALN